MAPSSTPTSAGRQTTLLGFFNKPTPGGSQSKPNTPSSSSRPAPKTPTLLGTSSKPVAGSQSKQSVSRTGSNSNVLQQQAQVQESPLGNKGKSRGLVRTPSDENKKKLGSSHSIRVEGEPIEIDLDTSVDLSMDLTMDTSMDVDVDVDLDNLDHDNDDGNNKEEEEDVFAAIPRSKTTTTAASTNSAGSASGSTPTSRPTAPKPTGFTPLVPKSKPPVTSGSSNKPAVIPGPGSSSPLSELEDLPETEISTSTSKSVPEVSKTDDVDVMDEEEAEESPIKMTVSHRCSRIRFATGRQT
jgi:hypothetical protein